MDFLREQQCERFHSNKVNEFTRTNKQMHELILQNALKISRGVT